MKMTGEADPTVALIVAVLVGALLVAVLIWTLVGAAVLYALSLLGLLSFSWLGALATGVTLAAASAVLRGLFRG